jgi:OOP family OmpA-OmpF porin
MRNTWCALACGQRAVQCFTTATCAALVVICAALRENPAPPRGHVRFGESQHDWTTQIDPLLPRAVATRLPLLSNWVQWGMNKKAVRIASVVFCLVGAQTATAAERGFYMGGQVGQATKEVSRDFFEVFNDILQEVSNFVPIEEHTSIDDTDIAFSILGGYRFNSYLALEGSFTKYGTVTFKSRASGSFPLEGGTLNTNIESEVSGFGLAVVGALPLTRDWELFARGGMLFANNKIRLVVDATGQQFLPAPGDFDLSGNDSTQETFAAVGISRQFFDIYALRLEYQRVFNAGGEATAQGDLDAVLLGLNVTF